MKKFGTINGYDIYEDPYLEEDKIIVGKKTNDILGNGLVYMPYIIVQKPAIVVDGFSEKIRKIRNEKIEKILK